MAPPVATVLLDGLWAPAARMNSFARRLAPLVGRTLAFRYDASALRPLDSVGDDLARYLDGLGGPVDLVAFSMGGLVARAAAARHPGLRLRRAAFLCTPHAGSLLAWGLPLPAFRQMRPGSAFLRALDSAPWAVPTYSVWCPGDLMVLPGRSARFGAAQFNEPCRVPLHMWPLFSHRIVGRLAAFLREGSPDRAE